MNSKSFEDPSKLTPLHPTQKDWQMKSLSEGITLISGQHVLAQYCNTIGEGTPYITGPSDFIDGSVTSAYFTTNPVSNCRKNDILITVKGSGTGKIFIADKAYCISRQLMAIRSEIWSQEFIYYSLKLNQKFFEEKAAGLIPGITRGDILKFKIPVSPIHEQRAIASLLNTWEKAINILQLIIDGKEKKKKWLMQQLLTGKKRLKGFNGEWKVVKLGDIANVKGGKRLPKGENLVNENTGYPYIRISDIYMGGIDPRAILYVPKHIEPLIKNYKISSNDLFVTVAGTIGLVGEVPQELNNANLTENADKITVIGADKKFVLYFLMSDMIQSEIQSVSTNNAQPKLALEKIRNFSISYPPLKEQIAIASVLSSADKELALLREKLARQKKQKNGLIQALLTGTKRLKV